MHLHANLFHLFSGLTVKAHEFILRIFHMWDFLVSYVAIINGIYAKYGQLTVWSICGSPVIQLWHHNYASLQFLNLSLSY